jgi:hypothetical protein
MRRVARPGLLTSVQATDATRLFAIAPESDEGHVPVKRYFEIDYSHGSS